MAKIDHRKELKHLYGTRVGQSVIVEVPPMNFLMVNGKGHPEEQAFQDAASTIYPVAYTLKFMIKANNPEHDYRVMPLEVKWSLNRQEHGSKRYNWTMMVMQPEFVTHELYLEAIEKAQLKRDMPSLSSLRFESVNEGLCGQIMHKGPFGKPMDERFEGLKQYLREQGYEAEPDSHDIYLNDMRRTKPENLKTIIRTKISKID